MPVLKLKFKDVFQKDFVFHKGDSLTIGRLQENNICIENLAVSSHHAKVDAVGEGILLTDLKSKNGTFVNGAAITAHWLTAGDEVQIGKHVLVFEYLDGETPAGKPPAAMVQTMVMDAGAIRNLASDRGTPETPVQPEPPEKTGFLTFLSGGDGEFELTRKLTKIGKSTTSDIIVSGLTVGQTAATISRRPLGYYLSYVGGISRPKVNGEAVKDSVLLKDFDVITIGSNKMQFVYGKPSPV